MISQNKANSINFKLQTIVKMLHKLSIMQLLLFITYLSVTLVVETTRILS